MIRWLHISDLHLNDGNFSSARLRDELPSFLGLSVTMCSVLETFALPMSVPILLQKTWLII